MSTYVHNNDIKVIFHLPTSREKKGERERERERERENKFKDCQYFYRIHFNLATEPQGDLISRRYDLLAEHQ